MGSGTGSLECPRCAVPLNLLQPDENDPSRLLGLCEACSRWVFLVEVESDWKQAILVELPSSATIRRWLSNTKTARRPRRGG
jgi:hypothetical protein